MPNSVVFYRFERHLPSVVPLTTHDEGQAFILTHGAISFLTPAISWILTPGRLCWIPPGLPHGFTSRSPVAGISAKLIQPEGLPERARLLDHDPFLVSAFRRALDVPRDRDDLWKVIARAVFAGNSDRLALPAPTDRHLQKMAIDLMACPSDPRSLADWAHHIGLSPRSLMRKLMRETGLSFTPWRRRMRLIHALDRMQAGESATAAALSAGFGSSASFSAAFRRETGTTPTAYLNP